MGRRVGSIPRVGRQPRLHFFHPPPPPQTLTAACTCAASRAAASPSSPRTRCASCSPATATTSCLFFFFRQTVDRNHTARNLARDFAAQLLPHSPALVAALIALSQTHGVRDHELDLLWPTLVEALRRDEAALRRDGGGAVYCVVDALDEMEDRELEGMVGRLVKLGTRDG